MLLMARKFSIIVSHIFLAFYNLRFGGRVTVRFRNEEVDIMN